MFSAHQTVHYPDPLLSFSLIVSHLIRSLWVMACFKCLVLNCPIYLKPGLLNIRNRTEWMKGVCHRWSRGRYFSPSLPGDRYLKLSSQKRSAGQIAGYIVWYDALEPRPDRVLLFYIFCLRMFSYNSVNFLSYSWEKISALGQVNVYKSLLMAVQHLDVTFSSLLINCLRYLPF